MSSLAFASASASAHPMGGPQAVTFIPDKQDSTQLLVHYEAQPDDITTLASELGVLPDTRSFVYDNGAFVPEESDPGDGQLLGASPLFEQYVFSHLKLSTASGACVGKIVHATDISIRGASFRFQCPDDVSTLTAQISLLTDLDPNYKTTATSPSGESFTYTADADTHVFSIGAATSAEPESAGTAAADADTVATSQDSHTGAVIGVIAGIVAIALGGGVVLFTRRREKRVGHQPSQATAHIEQGI